jgi:chromosome partitioning protein
MHVVAVINRKGGSGKSTLATHLASHCAHLGLRVMLGDVDLQHTSLAWLARRAGRPGVVPISGWAVDRQAVVRPPSGVTHVVLDTPGGLRGAELARAVFASDVVLIPVCASQFDRESALECHAELLKLPRVASGRCKVGVVGMRLHPSSRQAHALPAWAAAHGLSYIGGIASSEAYVHMAEEGLTLFDLPPEAAPRKRQQWATITDWLDSTWTETQHAQQRARAPMRPVDRVAASPQSGRATWPVRPATPTMAVSPVRRLGWLFNMFLGANHAPRPRV